MGQEDFDTLLTFFKALGNESRLKILGLLANQERSVGELAELLNVKEPTVSHHLQMLRHLGLVDVRADGNTRYYRLDVKQLEEMNRDIFSSENLAELVEDVEQTYAAKVLRAFTENGRLKAIPAQSKKKDAILAWLVERFESDRRYAEAEVNEIIKEVHPDSASLRRFMIEFKYMARENGVYWRLPDPRTS